MTSSTHPPPAPAGPRVPTWFHTFGCKANQYDTERIRQELEGRGAAAVDSPAGAAVAVINTCTVTNEADRDARRLIRRLKGRNPGLRVLVTGCSATLRADEYRAMPEVWRVVPGQDPDRVAEHGWPRPSSPSGAARPVHLQGAGASLLTSYRRGTRAWLKIQDGCDRKCSFCATRLARGVSRSRSPAEIVREARILAEAHPELVLTGIHIGHYGRDLDGKITLGELCRRLLEDVANVRFRLSSVEATEIDEPLVEVLTKADGRLVPHLHVPLQSGSNAVLRRMRRWHTREAYRARVLEIASRLPYLGLGADIIAGFPGETAGDHADTVSLVESLPFTYLHVFPFSARRQTEAERLPDRVPGDVIAGRARELRELGQEKGAAYRRSRLDGPAEVIVERADPVPSGLTEDYLRVELEPDGSSGEAVTGPHPGTRLVGTLAGAPGRLRLAM